LKRKSLAGRLLRANTLRIFLSEKETSSNYEGPVMPFGPNRLTLGDAWLDFDPRPAKWPEAAPRSQTRFGPAHGSRPFAMEGRAADRSPHHPLRQLSQKYYAAVLSRNR